MNALQALQRQMLQAVLAATAPNVPDIVGDARADAQSRLTVYRHGYRVRLREALGSEFPGLRCMAGDDFDGLLDAYIDAHPSVFYSIRWHGKDLADFLQASWRDKPQFADMARLDWAISTAFDAPDQPCMDVAQLASISPGTWPHLRFLLHAEVQWFAHGCNVDAFRRAADCASARPRLRRHAQPRRMLVWRHELAVHYRRLDDDEWQVLEAVRQGQPFAVLCSTLAQTHGEAAAAARMVALLQAWLQAGLVQGLAPA